jgi:hypothetical protein
VSQGCFLKRLSIPFVENSARGMPNGDLGVNDRIPSAGYLRLKSFQNENRLQLARFIAVDVKGRRRGRVLVLVEDGNWKKLDLAANAKSRLPWLQWRAGHKRILP